MTIANEKNTPQQIHRNLFRLTADELSSAEASALLKTCGEKWAGGSCPRTWDSTAVGELRPGRMQNLNALPPASGFVGRFAWEKPAHSIGARIGTNGG